MFNLPSFGKGKPVDGAAKSIFDKTGTLTTGKFEVSELNIIEGNEEEVKNIIYNISILDMTVYSSVLSIKTIKNRYIQLSVGTDICWIKCRGIAS